MHNLISSQVAAAAAPRLPIPGLRARRLALFGAAALTFFGGVLPTFAQSYVTQYSAATGPTGMALDTVAGVTYLYVADEAHGNVLKLNAATGTTVATFGSGGQGDQPGQFGRPYGIAVDPATHDLYVTERLNGRVQRINSTTGASVFLWGTNDAGFNTTGQNVNPANPTSPQGHFQEPIGVAADASGNVYVVDHGNNRVQKFLVHQVNGAWTADNVAMWGTTGSANGQFDHPYGATLDSAGNLWVADGLNGRVQEFGPTGNYLGTLGSKGTADGQFVIATWVNFDATGALYVSSTNSDPQSTTAADINSQWISKFTVAGNSGTFVSRFGGTYGSNPGELKLPFDVVVDATNKAYVSDYYNSRVQVFDLTAAPAGGTSGGSSSGGTSSGGTTGGTTSGGTTSGGTTGGTTSGGTTGGTSSGGATGGTTGGGTPSTGGTSGGTTTGSANVNVVSATPPANGTYRAGDALIATIHFSAAVRVSGVKVDSGDDDDSDEAEASADGSASIAWTAVPTAGITADTGELRYRSGSGTDTLTFWYHVHGNDSAPNGIALGTSIVLPSGGSITDANGQALSADQLTLHWAQNPLAGVMLVRANESNPGKGKDKNGAKHPKLINLSSRLRVEHGDAAHAVIIGFVVSGSASQSVLIRAVGPGLRAFGITDVLPNPALRVQDNAGRIIAQNNGWRNDANVRATGAAVGAFSLTQDSHDSALVTTLAPGAYTATVIGGDTSGMALVEVYDADDAASVADRQFVNISTRSFLEANDTLVAGFVVNGDSPKQVLVRAAGPALAALGLKGTLPDPALSVHNSTGAIVAQNDNWGTPQPLDSSHPAASLAEITTAAKSVGAFGFPAGSADAAVLVTLPPGAYTAVVTGNAGGSGMALVEVYEVTP
jgi:DNA-binding beta-propeller fold protein YncE